MVKVRVYLDEKEWDRIQLPVSYRKDKDIMLYRWYDSFEHEMKRFYNPLREGEVPQPPFRDEYSLQFLQAFDVKFIKGDWFSVLDRGRRIPIVKLSPDLRYALCLMKCSREGKFMTFRWCRRKVWRILNELPFDILVGVSGSEIAGGFAGELDYDEKGLPYALVDESGEESQEENEVAAVDLIGGIDYQIVDYPLGDGTAEVTVKKEISDSDTFYTPLAGQEYRGVFWGLRVGQDGKYYTSGCDLRRAFRYVWQNDLENIVQYICHDRREEKRICLARITKYYTEEEFIRILNGESVQTAGRPEVGVLKITSHLLEAPDRPENCFLPLLIVERKLDGPYECREEVSGEEASWEDLLPRIVGMKSPGCERFVLVVDVRRALRCSQDIEKTVCGFLVSERALEVFEKGEAIRMFGERLKDVQFGCPENA